MSSKSRSFRLALCQFTVGRNKSTNIETAINNIRQAVKEKGANVVALPECFNCPYDTNLFHEYAEEIPAGETSLKLSSIAKELKIHLIAGTIPEIDRDNKIYNTCTVWSPNGDLIATYRKLHPFDIEIPGGSMFRESDVFTPGNRLAMFEIENCKIGIGICYDIRFSELAGIYRKQGCDVLIYLGAFNMTTGPLHWELLGRARACDNQTFVGLVSLARNVSAGFIAWGHSMVVDPWGKVLQEAEEGDEIIAQDIDCHVVDEVGAQIPISRQKRDELYEIIIKDPNLFTQDC